MAEVDWVAASASDAVGELSVIAVVEDTQTTVDPRGRVMPTVVACRVVNTSARKGQVTYQTPNGNLTTMTVLPGENQQTNISPPQRVFFHQWPVRVTWGEF